MRTPPADRLLEVATDGGPGRLVVSAGPAPSLVLVLGHGAGGGVEVPDLAALAGTLPGRGVAVVRFLQPWAVAGRRIAGSAATLDRAWLPAVEQVRGEFPGVPVAVGGHSAGARVACRTAASGGAVAVLALSFPLHPPGRPERTRVAELLGVPVPVRVVQGERDPFGSGAEIRAALAREADDRGIRVLDVPGAGHDLQPRARRDQTADAWWQRAAGEIAGWLLARADPGRGGPTGVPSAPDPSLSAGE